MPLVGFEPTISVFARATTVHSLDRAATIIGLASSTFQFTLIEQRTVSVLRYHLRMV
jgi:hypothetical protein